MRARPVKGESASSQAKGVAPKCQGRIVSLHISHYDDQSCVSHMSTRDTMRSVCPPTSASSPALHITITPTWLFTAVTAPPHETLYERKMGVWRALGSSHQDSIFQVTRRRLTRTAHLRQCGLGFFLCWVLELSCRSGRADRYIPLFPQQLHREEKIPNGGWGREMERRSRPPH